MGGCQNCGPFLGTLNFRCRIIIRTQKRDHNFDNHPYRNHHQEPLKKGRSFRLLTARVNRFFSHKGFAGPRVHAFRLRGCSPLTGFRELPLTYHNGYLWQNSVTVWMIMGIMGSYTEFLNSLTLRVQERLRLNILGFRV